MQIKKSAKQLIKRLILPNKQNKITKMVNFPSTAAEVTTMHSYIVGIGSVLRDIETHAQYVMAKAKSY